MSEVNIDHIQHFAKSVIDSVHENRRRLHLTQYPASEQLLHQYAQNALTALDKGDVDTAHKDACKLMQQLSDGHNLTRKESRTFHRRLRWKLTSPLATTGERIKEL